LIKYKGLQVAPAELEAVLLSHPLVLDAAVIGVLTDDGTNEVPRAYVVADKSKIASEEIVEFVKGKVAGHKQLRGGVRSLHAGIICDTNTDFVYPFLGGILGRDS